MLNGKRILVLGCPGSGKSTFAQKLHDITLLPLYHLDSIWWRPDRTHISREEFDLALTGILDTEQWILDGNYTRTYEMRLRACDTAVFLDFDTDVCMEGILQRIGKPRPDLPWIEDAPDPELCALVSHYRETNRPVLLALLDQFPGIEKLVFVSRSEADLWLKNLEASIKVSGPKSS